MNKKTAMLWVLGSLLMSNVSAMEPAISEKAQEQTYIQFKTISPIGRIEAAKVIDKKRMPFSYESEQQFFQIFKSLAARVSGSLENPVAAMELVSALRVETAGLESAKQYFSTLMEATRAINEVDNRLIGGLEYEINHLKFLKMANGSIEPVRFVALDKLDDVKFTIHRGLHRAKTGMSCILSTIPDVIGSGLQLTGQAVLTLEL